MRIARFSLVLLLLLPVLSGCKKDDENKTTISISGAFALYPMVIQWADEYQKTHPDVEFDISAGGAGKGMSDALAGAVDIAMVSREIRSAETDQGAVGIPVTKDAVVPTANANNPVLDQLLTTGLTSEHGAQVWISSELKTWGQLVGSDDTSEIHVYTRADACGAGEVWALYLGGTAQEDLSQGDNIGAPSDPEIARAVQDDPLGIGYNNLNFAYDPNTQQPIEGLVIIPIDLNGDGQISDDENFYNDKTSLTAAIAEGIYPSPPARVLYLVTKGQPDGAAADFIRWVLTDGQTFVSGAGYVQLTNEQLQTGLALLPTE
jgi:phosphate transport system substrate-binding protein